jgi:hypothetical protein
MTNNQQLLNLYTRLLNNNNRQIEHLFNIQSDLLDNINQLSVDNRNRHRNRNNIPVYTIPSNQNNFLNTIRSFYDAVPIIPTRLQIENSTRMCQFSQIENPLNLNCPITLERFSEQHDVTQILNCGHIFNSNSIRAWFQNSTRCPVCRYDIRDTNINSSDPTPTNVNSSDHSIPITTSSIPTNTHANRHYIITPTTSLTDLTETILEQLFNL